MSTFRFRTLRIAVWVILFALVCVTAQAAGKKKSAVILSTVDLPDDYEILGVVAYRSNALNVDKIHKELSERASGMGGDHVIGITYFGYAGYLYGAGTAVKLISDDDEESEE